MSTNHHNATPITSYPTADFPASILVKEYTFGTGNNVAVALTPAGGETETQFWARVAVDFLAKLTAQGATQGILTLVPAPNAADTDVSATSDISTQVIGFDRLRITFEDAGGDEVFDWSFTKQDNSKFEANTYNNQILRKKVDLPAL